MASVMGAVLIALCALAVCGYRYGMYDQGQYLVQVVDLEHPGHLDDDPYTGVFRSLRSVVWIGMAAFTTEQTRPTVTLMVTVGIVTTNVLLLGAIVCRLIRWRVRGWPLVIAASLPALMLVVPKEQNWFGLVSLGDLELTATLMVMPFLFGSILAWMTERRLVSLALALLAVGVQGQTGVYLVVAWIVASCIEGIFERRVPLGAIGLAGIGAILARVEVMNGTVGVERLEAYRQVGLDLYAPLINPLVAPWTAWAATVVLLVLGTAACWAMRRADAVSPSSHRLLVWAMASMAFPVVGLTLLAFGIRDPLLWKLMVGRSLMLPQLVAIVLIAEWSIRMVASGGSRCWIGATTVVAMVVWPFPEWSMPVAAVSLAILVIAVATGIPTSVSSSSRPARRRVAVGSLAAVACAIGLAIPSAQGGSWLRSNTQDDWHDAQAWAARHTPPGAVFVTPPYRCGWRLGAHRPTFGELKDGGLTFYAGDAVMEWARRMDLLGMRTPYRWVESFGDAVDVEIAEAYGIAVQANLDEIAGAAPIRFVVTERVADIDVGTPVWSNASFVIRVVDLSDGQPTTTLVSAGD